MLLRAPFASLACALAVYSCAVPEPYWALVTSPVPLLAVEEGHKNPACRASAHQVMECANRATGVVTIKPIMSMACRVCLIGHGAQHLAGKTHVARPTFDGVVVCADGSTQVCQ